MYSTKLWRISEHFMKRSFRFYSNNPDKLRQSHQKFNPSFGKSGESNVESHTKNIKTYNIEKIIEEKITKEKKVRKLYYWDKWILVKLGKFKSIKDVPDELKLTGSKIGNEELKNKVKSELLETGFKYVYSIDYLLWAFCIAFCVPLFYWYYNNQLDLQPQKNTDNSKSKSDQV